VFLAACVEGAAAATPLVPESRPRDQTSLTQRTEDTKVGSMFGAFGFSVAFGFSCGGCWLPRYFTQMESLSPERKPWLSPGPEKESWKQSGGRYSADELAREQRHGAKMRFRARRCQRKPCASTAGKV